MDLQTEYIRRHNLNVIVGTPDSYFLFKSKQMLCVAMISHRPRTYTSCTHCKKGNLVVEVWQISPNGMGLFIHTHVNPDEDLISKIKENCNIITEIEIIRYQGEEHLTDLIWKAIGGKGKNTKKEMFESVKNNNDKVSNLELVLSTITYRKQPLLFDVLKDT